jgi:hypothetical protein
MFGIMRKVLLPNLRTIQDDPGIERDHLVFGDKQWIDLNLFDSRKAFTPSTEVRLGLMGWIGRPAKSRFSIRARPTLFGASLAPIRATVPGFSIALRTGRRSMTAVRSVFSFSFGGWLILGRD